MAHLNGLHARNARRCGQQNSLSGKSVTHLASVVRRSVSRASFRPTPAMKSRQVRPNRGITGKRGVPYCGCPSAAASSSCSLCCELTRDCVTSSDHGPRGLVASLLHCNAPIRSGPSALRTRSKDAVAVGPRPEKHDLRVDRADLRRVRRLAVSGGWAIDSPWHCR